MEHYTNDFSKIDYNNIILSYIGKNIKPRFILGDNIYPISCEIENCIAPFGIDNAYGKMYMKLSIYENSKIIHFLKNIDDTISKLIMEKEQMSIDSNINRNTIQTMLDNNIIIQNDDGKHLSSFNINKASVIKKIQMQLGDVYYITKSKKYAYKWIVNKIIL